MLRLSGLPRESAAFCCGASCTVAFSGDRDGDDAADEARRRCWCCWRLSSPTRSSVFSSSNDCEYELRRCCDAGDFGPLLLGESSSSSKLSLDCSKSTSLMLLAEGDASVLARPGETCGWEEPLPGAAAAVVIKRKLLVVVRFGLCSSARTDDFCGDSDGLLTGEYDSSLAGEPTCCCCCACPSLIGDVDGVMLRRLRSIDFGGISGNKSINKLSRALEMSSRPPVFFLLLDAVVLLLLS